MAKRRTVRKPDPILGDHSKLDIVYWPTDRPQDYPANARKWTQKAVDKVRTSIREFGFRQPVVVDVNDVIIIGHLRRKAAREEGLAQIPVHVAKELTPEQVRQLRLMDNRSHDEAEWDLELLSQEMKELAAMELDLSLTGFDKAEFVQFIAGMGNTDPDEVPPVPAVPVSRTGDLWLLGDHRLLCGDCTDAEAVARLMNGEKAGLIATDPPYGINYNSADLHSNNSAWAPLTGDHHQDEALQRFLESAFTAALTAIQPNAAWYLWHAMLTQGFFAAAAAAAAAHVLLHRQIIWVKPALVFGRGQFHWKHELCFMGWSKGNEPPDYSDHKDVTVWEVDGVSTADRRDFDHATPKPVELFRRPMVKHLQTGEIAFEPFAGSGPQFIAAEVTARRCFGVELEPKYVDVIVDRWQNFTGRTARLEDGQSFEDIAEIRREALPA